ncbi:MFS transporter [Gayadomonas joobiniege]|uniref:MFS transporter n=1 Tax=Gayadomonas joobiniege TaxID=1234606 RepID=UPI00036ACDB5|nr:MFS transporter [Gayadomonas joobiniege]
MFSALTSRLSQVYFAYFAILGVVSHYLGLYLVHQGLTPFEVGVVLAVMTCGRIIGPLAGAAQTFIRLPKKAIIAASGVALACFSWVAVSEGALWLAMSLGCFAFFWSALLPQLETLSNLVLQGDSHKYSRVRLWGSLSFILLAILAGSLFEIFGVVKTLESATLSLLVLLFVCCFRLPDEPTEVGSKISDRSLIKSAQPFVVFSFFACSFLLQASFASYYGFFSVYMEASGYTGQMTGILIAIGVLVEILVFIKAGFIMSKASLLSLMLFCLLMTSMRWFATAFIAEQLVLLMLVQSLHALSFALYHVCAQKFIFDYFPKDQQSRAQALYLAVSTGLGGALGNLATGAIWQKVAHYSYFFSAILCLLAAALMYAARQHTLGRRCIT